MWQILQEVLVFVFFFLIMQSRINLEISKHVMRCFESVSINLPRAQKSLCSDFA